MKLMNIDDSNTMRKIVSLSLKSGGYEVIEAIHGQDALSKLSNNELDLFIVDINMPVMGGIDFIKNLKKLPNHKNTPIIILTTQEEEKKINEGLNLGANAWITKPFNRDQLLAKVKELIN